MKYKLLLPGYTCSIAWKGYRWIPNRILGLCTTHRRLIPPRARIQQACILSWLDSWLIWSIWWDFSFRAIWSSCWRIGCACSSETWCPWSRYLIIRLGKELRGLPLLPAFRMIVYTIRSFGSSPAVLFSFWITVMIIICVLWHLFHVSCSKSQRGAQLHKLYE